MFRFAAAQRRRGARKRGSPASRGAGVAGAAYRSPRAGATDWCGGFTRLSAFRNAADRRRSRRSLLLRDEVRAWSSGMTTARSRREPPGLTAPRPPGPARASLSRWAGRRPRPPRYSGLSSVLAPGSRAPPPRRPRPGGPPRCSAPCPRPGASGAALLTVLAPSRALGQAAPAGGARSSPTGPGGACCRSRASAARRVDRRGGRPRLLVIAATPTSRRVCCAATGGPRRLPGAGRPPPRQPARRGRPPRQALAAEPGGRLADPATPWHWVAIDGSYRSAAPPRPRLPGAALGTTPACGWRSAASSVRDPSGERSRGLPVHRPRPTGYDPATGRLPLGAPEPTFEEARVVTGVERPAPAVRPGRSLRTHAALPGLSLVTLSAGHRRTRTRPAPIASAGIPSRAPRWDSTLGARPARSVEPCRPSLSSPRTSNLMENPGRSDGSASSLAACRPRDTHRAARASRRVQAEAQLYRLAKLTACNGRSLRVSSMTAAA